MAMHTNGVSFGKGALANPGRGRRMEVRATLRTNLGKPGPWKERARAAQVGRIRPPVLGITLTTLLRGNLMCARRRRTISEPATVDGWLARA